MRSRNWRRHLPWIFSSHAILTLFWFLGAPLITINTGIFVPRALADEAAKPFKTKRSTKQQPGDYSRYRAAMVEICELTNRDARGDAVHAILFKLSEKDPACIDCRPFFNTFASACKPKLVVPRTVRKPVKPAEEEELHDDGAPIPTPESTKIALQRLPSAVLIDRVAQLSDRLALDEKLNRQTIQVIDRLLAALRSPEGRSIGEREYFGMLADYFGYAWEDLRHLMAAEQKKREEEEALANATEITGFREQGATDSSSTKGLFE